MKSLLYITLVIMACEPHVAIAQQSDVQIKLQLAQSYERNNDWERAVGIYEELYAKDSTNIVLFENLRRSYMQLKRHEDAIRIIQTQMRIRPNDIGLFANLGVAYARDGNEAKAIEAWNRTIALGQRNFNTYHVIANAAIESRLLERAVDFYLQGRKAMGDPMAFTMEIANLYSAMMNFADATREYIKLLQQSPAQLNIVQSRMSLYTHRPEALREATKVVEQTMRTQSDVTSFYQLYAWLLMEGKQFERAFDTYVELDRRTNAGGRELFNFAERAFKEKAYSTAAKAYQTIVSQYPQFDRISFAKFGYARTTEALLTSTDSAEQGFLFTQLMRGEWGMSTSDPLPSETQSKLASVIASFNNTAREYPRSEIAAQSLLRVASIQFQHLFDLDAAAATLQQLQKDYSFLPHRAAEATLLLGDVFLTKGDIDEAPRQYQQCLKFPGTKEKARYRLAETEFFRGKFNEATDALLELTKEPKSDMTNDALSLLVFIQDHSQPSTSALTEFAKANFLVRQRKYPDALLIFQRLEAAYPSSSLLDETLMLSGDLLTAMGKYTEGITAYERLISQFPESIILDRVIMKIGYIQQKRLNNTTAAIASYQSVLEQFPHSLYANEARKRIRELRGESL
jgi:TolA-binding protein